MATESIRLTDTRTNADGISSPASSEQRNIAMEGLRGLAIILVFLAHYAEFSRDVIGYSSPVSSFLFNVGQSGVDLFFIISGYLIYGSLIKNSFNFLEYTKRRLIRIYPAFAAVLAIYIICFIFMPSRSKLPGTSSENISYILLNFTLLPILPFFGGIKPIITATWTLAYELLFYLTIPAIVIALRLKAMTPRSRLALWLIASAAAFTSMHLANGNSRPLMFIAGIILFECLQGIRIRSPRWIGAAALGAGLLAVGTADLRVNFPSLPLFILFTVGCLEAFSRPDSLGGILAAPGLRFLGNMSYSFYLLHGLVVQTCFVLIAKIKLPINFYLGMAPIFAVAVSISFLLFVLVERPFSLKPGKRQR